MRKRNRNRNKNVTQFVSIFFIHHVVVFSIVIRKNKKKAMNNNNSILSSPEPPPLLSNDDNSASSSSALHTVSLRNDDNEEDIFLSSIPHVEEYFESMPTDFLEAEDDDSGFVENERIDKECNLTPQELSEFLTHPDCSQWEDYPSHDHPTFITMDEAKERQWFLAKEEIDFIRSQVQKLIGKDDVQKKDIVQHTIGLKSSIAIYLKRELALSDEEYLKLMSTICIQSAYGVTSTQLFHPMSILKDKVKTNEDEYNKLWREFSEKRMLDGATIGTNRRETPIWRTMEDLVNSLCRSISISGREGEISIALDDDKIWLSQTKSKTCDLFGLKYTTHVKPNRKGIVGHTAVSTGTNIPLGIVFEQTFDTSLTCFKRLLNFLFHHDSESKDENAFRNVTVHSDRGYLVPSLVFDFLLTNGANIVGTVKRMAGCWPFTFDQKVTEDDTRTKIDPKGAPALFLKWCKGVGTSVRQSRGTRRLFASAFRNGSQKVATAISSLHAHHQWEGVALDPRELAAYKRDKKSLQSKFFGRVDDVFLGIEEDEERNKMKEILEERIVPMTLRQGKNHYLNLVKVLDVNKQHSNFLSHI